LAIREIRWRVGEVRPNRGEFGPSDPQTPAEALRGSLMHDIISTRLFRVPGVYLTWANPVFLAFFSFNRISNLRVFSVAFSSIPTAPTSFLFDSTGLARSARQQKAAIREWRRRLTQNTRGTDGKPTNRSTHSRFVSLIARSEQKLAFFPICSRFIPLHGCNQSLCWGEQTRHGVLYS
jgi:hypothetical protein